MTWSELYDELAAFLDEHNPLAVALQGKNPQEKIDEFRHLFEIEPLNRAIIDAACDLYIQTGRFPGLNQDQAILLFVRFGHAAQAAEFFLLNSDVLRDEFEDSRKANLLNFLLIRYWKFAGRSRWMTT
jgi:hypothetical protein